MGGEIAILSCDAISSVNDNFYLNIIGLPLLVNAYQLVHHISFSCVVIFLSM